MNSMYSINFLFYKENKTLIFNENISLKDMLSQYAQTIGLKNCDSLVFIANGSYIDSNSLKTLKNFSNNEVSFLVFEKEKEEDEDNTICETEVLDKINNKEFKRRNLRNLKIKLMEILTDMSLLGELTKNMIKNTLLVKPYLYMPINEAIQQNNEYFILGILAQYLNSLGIHTVIDRNTEINEKYKNMANTILQFLFNGLIFKKKYYLSFALNEFRIRQLLNSKIEQKNFKETLTNLICKQYGIPLEDIKVTNPVQDPYYKVIVLIQDDNISLTREALMAKFIKHKDLSTLKEVKKENIIEGIILNQCMLDSYGDCKDGNWAHYEERGGEDYLPPDGWDRYGLSVYKKYDNGNNDWLSSDNRKGEWCIGYRWLAYNKNVAMFNNLYEDDNDTKNNGKKVGKGIYFTQNPDTMEKYTGVIKTDKGNFKLGLMLRVNPSKIRSPQSNKEDLWVVDGYSDEIRPYGILIKELK